MNFNFIFTQFFVLPFWKIPILCMSLIYLLVIASSFARFAGAIPIVTFILLSCAISIVFAFAFHQWLALSAARSAVKYAKHCDCRFHKHAIADYFSNEFVERGLHMGTIYNEIPFLANLGLRLPKDWADHVAIYSPASDSTKLFDSVVTFSGGFASYIFVRDPPSEEMDEFLEFCMKHEVAHTSMTEDIFAQRYDFNPKIIFVATIWIAINSNFNTIGLLCALTLFSLNALMVLYSIPKERLQIRLIFEVLADFLALQLSSQRTLDFMRKILRGGYFTFQDRNLTELQNSIRSEYLLRNLNAIRAQNLDAIKLPFAALGVPAIPIALAFIMLASCFFIEPTLFPSIILSVLMFVVGFTAYLLVLRGTLVAQKELLELTSTSA